MPAKTTSFAFAPSEGWLLEAKDDSDFVGFCLV